MKNITFIPSSLDAELFIPSPKPAINYLPNWYKSTPTYRDGAKPLINGTSVFNNTVRACRPLLDSLTGGYIQETWCDVNIEFDEEVKYSSSSPQPAMSLRNNVNVKVNNNFHNNEFTWIMPWIPKLPPGFSILFVHPLNRIDLPFQTLSAIIDADVFYHEGLGNVPFFVNKGFSGIIPAGTPMYQMIPVYREEWETKIEKFNELENRKNMAIAKKHFIGSYKKIFHKKKVYK